MKQSVHIRACGNFFYIFYQIPFFFHLSCAVWLPRPVALHLEMFSAVVSSHDFTAVATKYCQSDKNLLTVAKFGLQVLGSRKEKEPTKHKRIRQDYDDAKRYVQVHAFLIVCLLATTSAVQTCRGDHDCGLVLTKCVHTH